MGQVRDECLFTILKNKTATTVLFSLCGGDKRIRTAGLLVANEALYQLSHIPNYFYYNAFFVACQDILYIFYNNCSYFVFNYLALRWKQEVKEGRFDFSLTYEVDGEVKTYTGVYVCEYDGVLTTLLGSSLQ